MDWNGVIFSDWFGALGSGVVAVVITAVGLPAPPPEAPAPAPLAAASDVSACGAEVAPVLVDHGGVATLRAACTGHRAGRAGR